MGTIVEKLNKLLGTKAAIKAAIIEKGQEVGDIFAEYPDKIRAIETGTGLDTSDANASASDLCIGKTAYVNGEKITGTVTEVEETNVVLSNFDEIAQSGAYVSLDGTYDEDKLFRVGSYVQVSAPLTSFGNAIAADVASGKTFTSSAGLLVKGSASIAETAAITIINDSSEGIDYYTRSSERNVGSSYDTTFNMNVPGVLPIRHSASARVVHDDGVEQLRVVSNDSYSLRIYSVSDAGEYTITIIDR